MQGTVPVSFTNSLTLVNKVRVTVPKGDSHPGISLVSLLRLRP